MTGDNSVSISDQEVLDYISSSAELLESLKSENALLSEKLSKAASEIKDLQNKLSTETKKQASYTPASIINKEQAELIVSNLSELDLLDKNNIKLASETLVANPSKAVELINGLIGKVASYQAASRGRGVTSTEVKFKKLSEEEQIERDIFFGK